MQISLDRTEIDIRPGRASRITVELHNTGDSADMISLSIDVPGSAWVITAQPVIRVSRAETVFVIAEIYVGRDVAAGVHDALLWARSATDPGRSVATRLKMTVEPVPGVRLVVSPSVLDTRSESTTSATVSNTGNTPLSISLGTRDPAGQVTCRISATELSLPVGGSAEVDVEVSVPPRRVGTVTRRLVGVEVGATSPAGEVTTEEYITIRHRPMLDRTIARWVATALVVVVAAVIGIVVLSGDGGELGKTPAPGFIVGGVESAPSGSVDGRVVAASDGRGVPRATIEALREAGDGTAISFASVATDSDGAFAIGDLPGGTYRLAVSAVGFADSVGEQFVVVPDTDLEIDDVVISAFEASLVLEIGVDDPSALGGRPEVAIETVSVEDRDAAAATSVLVGDDGRAVARLDGLPSPSTQRVTITAPGHVQRVIDIAVPAGQVVEVPATVLVAEPGSISGRVIDTAAVPLGGVTVRATSGAVTATTTTDAVTGSYTLEGLRSARTYLVEFSADGYASQTLAVDVGAGESVAEVNGSLIGSAGVLSGVVRSTDGTPIGSARVMVRGPDSVVTTATLTSVSAEGGPGSYRVSGLAVPGTYTVTVTADGYLPRTEAVTFVVASLDSELSIELQPATGTVNGTVSASGAPIGGVTVRIDDGRETRTVVSASSPAGAFTFSGLNPGSYTVSASADGYDEQILLVRVESGDTLDVALVLAATVGSGS